MALPESTSITQLGLSAEQISRLTPAAKALTKRDLILLAYKQKDKKTKKLTSEDLNSIEAAFSDFGKNIELAKDGVSCCTCTPCCSCSAAAVSA